MNSPHTLSLCLVVAAATACGGNSSTSPVDANLPNVADANLASTGELFASTQKSLYRFDPINGVLTLVAPYSCIFTTPDPVDTQDGMADIAIDRSGNMYGVGRIVPSGDLWLVQVNPLTAECSPIAALGNDYEPSGLTFVPVGTVDPSVEALVGNSITGDYYRFNTTTGEQTAIGTLGVNSDTKNSDIVSIIDGGAFTTQTQPGGGNDHLLSINPLDGSLIADIGDLGYDLVAGLGYWRGVLFGFTYDGVVLAINPTTAAATEVPTDIAPDGFFWGAAVTTAAPVD